MGRQVAGGCETRGLGRLFCRRWAVGEKTEFKSWKNMRLKAVRVPWRFWTVGSEKAGLESKTLNTPHGFLLPCPSSPLCVSLRVPF